MTTKLLQIRDYSCPLCHLPFTPSQKCLCQLSIVTEPIEVDRSLLWAALALITAAVVLAGFGLVAGF